MQKKYYKTLDWTVYRTCFTSSTFTHTIKMSPQLGENVYIIYIPEKFTLTKSNRTSVNDTSL